MGGTDTTIISGEVLENLPNALFRVKLSDDRVLLCYVSGKMRSHHIKVLPGDMVDVEMTPYDKDRGRIVLRR